MKGFKGYLKILLFILVCFVFQDINAQFSKTHYIPPLATQGFWASEPEDQYLYISTPNENPISVTIFPIGGTPVTNDNVSNSSPWPYYIGNGNNTNLIALTSDSDNKFNNKGFIVEADDLVYVSARLFGGGGNSFQAGSIVSKGLAGIGKEFRVGTFLNGGGNNVSSTYLNFVSVLATEDNTILNFSDFDQGVQFINTTPPSDIILNSGESYIVGIAADETSENTDGLIGTLVIADKPVAVNTGSFCGSNTLEQQDGSGQDIGIDQIAPVERIGTEYIFVRGIGPDEVERPLIVAHENNTEVYVNGNLYTTLALAGDYVSIESIEYGVSYLIDDYTGYDNVNNDGQIGDDGVWGPYGGGAGWGSSGNDDGPESIDGIPIDPDANLDDQPGLSESSSMYVNTNKPVFAYQGFGGVRPGTLSRYGITGGVANVGLFFVPPLNCQTPKIVKNIPSINAIGGELFNGIVTIVTETGSTVLINGQDISNYNALPHLVVSNPLFETYTIEGLTGDISVESTSQVYVASFGAYTYASFGGYYSGFAYKPVIVLDEITAEIDGCVPNLNLSLNSISTYDHANSTCINSNNGSILIEISEQTLTYNIEINNTTYLFNSNNGYSQTFSNLTPGIYNICINIQEIQNYQQCFDVNISEPEIFSVNSEISIENRSMNLIMNGSDEYIITINDEVTTTNNNFVTLNLKLGKNKIKVKTNLECQGIYEEEVFMGDNINYYPNPVDNELHINFSKNYNNIDILVFDILGKLILSYENIEILYNKSIINVSSLKNGNYLMLIKGKSINKSIRLIKK